MVRAQVWESPASITATPIERPETCTGADLDVVVPSPSCPASFLPQHITPPFVVSTQVWLPPAAIADTLNERPKTFTGVDLEVVVPSPSCPELLFPQHFTSLLEVSAHVWLPPAEIAATPLERLTTSTGEDEVVVPVVVVPSPRWPALFPPQHFTPPLEFIAQVWLPPAEIAPTPAERPQTSTGVDLSVAVPSPSRPSAFEPQHLTAPDSVKAQV
jgi:hypothetical protein